MVTESIVLTNGVTTCGCCKTGKHVVPRKGMDYMTCACSRKKCFLCFLCVIHCKCKEKMKRLQAQNAKLRNALEFCECPDCVENLRLIDEEA